MEHFTLRHVPRRPSPHGACKQTSPGRMVSALFLALPSQSGYRDIPELSAFLGLGPGSAIRAVFAGTARPQPGLDYARPRTFDAVRYKECNTAERCVSQLKQFRAVTTCYDKHEPPTREPSMKPRSGFGLSGPGRPGP